MDKPEAAEKPSGGTAGVAAGLLPDGGAVGEIWAGRLCSKKLEDPRE